MNHVALVGNLTRDPEVRLTPSGTAVADLGLAVNEKYKNRDGELVETTCFAEIVAWGRQAEVCQEYLTKGYLVSVEGRLQFDQWETDAGEKRSKLRVKAHRIQMLGRPRNGNGAPAGGTAQGQGHDEDEHMPF